MSRVAGRCGSFPGITGVCGSSFRARSSGGRHVAAGPRSLAGRGRVTAGSCRPAIPRGAAVHGPGIPGNTCGDLWRPAPRHLTATSARPPRMTAATISARIIESRSGLMAPAGRRGGRPLGRRWGPVHGCPGPSLPRQPFLQLLLALHGARAPAATRAAAGVCRRRGAPGLLLQRGRGGHLGELLRPDHAGAGPPRGTPEPRTQHEHGVRDCGEWKKGCPNHGFSLPSGMAAGGHLGRQPRGVRACPPRGHSQSWFGLIPPPPGFPLKRRGFPTSELLHPPTHDFCDCRR